MNIFLPHQVIYLLKQRNMCADELLSVNRSNILYKDTPFVKVKVVHRVVYV